MKNYYKECHNCVDRTYKCHSTCIKYKIAKYIDMKDNEKIHNINKLNNDHLQVRYNNNTARLKSFKYIGV